MPETPRESRPASLGELAAEMERLAHANRDNAHAVGHHIGTFGGSTQILSDSDRVVLHERATTWAEAARMVRELAGRLTP